jgi:type VI secretion system protein ImpJ
MPNHSRFDSPKRVPVDPDADHAPVKPHLKVAAMGWNNKVIWSEGMFLRTQHFQQAGRYVEALVRGRVDGLRPHAWGLTGLVINRDLLKTGYFGVSSCQGVLPDGTPFSVPDEADHPPALKLPGDARNVLVYLTLPVRQPGGREVAPTAAGDMVLRFGATEYEAIDENLGSDASVRLKVGRLALRYALETSDRGGSVGIGLARIVEVETNGNVKLDEGYIPPVLQCRASTPLAGFLTELQGLFGHRVDALAHLISGITASSGKAAGEIADFLLLATVNRYAPLFTHYAALADIHPEDFFALAVSAAGELATFANVKTRRPPVFPVYRHEDLQRTFAPVMKELRDSLSVIIDPRAFRIDLQDKRNGFRAGVIRDRSLLTGAAFVLAVKAQMSPEDLRRLLPEHIKIGSAETIRELVANALRGIRLTPLQVAPRQIPYQSGTTYFELDRTGEYWAQLSKSAGLVIHLAGDFPNVEMECWAIRE